MEIEFGFNARVYTNEVPLEPRRVLVIGDQCPAEQPLNDVLSERKCLALLYRAAVLQHSSAGALHGGMYHSTAIDREFCGGPLVLGH